MIAEKNPLKLQEICRSAIRILLRINAEAENPSLKDKKKLVPSRRKKGKRRIRKVVIPVFDDSAQSDERSVADEKRSTVDENFVDEEQPELDDEQKSQDKESVEYRQLFPDNHTCSEHSKPPGSCGCSTKESNLDDRSKVFDDCKEMPKAEGSRKASSLENSRRASSLEGTHASGSDNNSRRGSHSEGYNMNEEKLLDLMIASQRAKLQQECLGFKLELSAFNDGIKIQVKSHGAEAMDTSDAARSLNQPMNPDEMEAERDSNKDDSNSTQNIGNGDSGIDNISDDSVPEESSSDLEKTEGEAGAAPNPSTSHSLFVEEPVDAVEISRHITKLPTYLKRSAEENDDEEYTPRFCEKLRIAYSDADSDDFDDFESDSGKESFPKEFYGTREKSDLSCYTYYMKQKINLLPLPQFLKMYLNFSRPV